MTTASLARPLTQPPSRPNGWWGMLLVVATEGTLFAVLVASYFYIRFRAPAWPPGDVPDPTVVRPLVNNAFLLASIVPMLLAARAAVRRQQALLRLGLAAALLLGGGYFGLQLDSFSRSWETFRPQDSTYASLVYTIVGAHWIHVGAGLLLLAWAQLQAWIGSEAARRATTQVVALYWYFVTLLALPVLLTTLSPSV